METTIQPAIRTPYVDVRIAHLGGAPIQGIISLPRSATVPVVPNEAVLLSVRNNNWMEGGRTMRVIVSNPTDGSAVIADVETNKTMEIMIECGESDQMILIAAFPLHDLESDEPDSGICGGTPGNMFLSDTEGVSEASPRLGRVEATIEQAALILQVAYG